MPIYEYECESCNTVSEVVQRISEKPLAECPHCSGAVRKIVSRSAFHLKGGGWYNDGYNAPSSGCASKPASTSDSVKTADSPCASGGCPNAAGCPASAS